MGVTKKSAVSAVDLGKLVFAVFVVAIHTGVQDVMPAFVGWQIEHVVFRVAVPFFFICTGYFHAKKFLQHSDNREARLLVCLEYAKRNIPALLLWSGFGLMAFAGKSLWQGEALTVVLLKCARYALFYPMGAMWFVQASILAVLAIGILWDKRILLRILAMIGYGLALLCNTYFFLVKGTPLGDVIQLYMKVFVTARNFIGVGIILVGEGIWLATDTCFIKRLSDKVLMILTVLSILALYVESSCIFGKDTLDDASLFLSMPVVALLIVELLTRISMPYAKSVSICMRRMSADIYYTHRAVIVAIEIISFVVGWNTDGRQLIVFSLVLFVCTCIWFVFRKSENPSLRRVLP